MNDREDATEPANNDPDWVYMASTRPIRAAGDDHLTQFSRSALEDMAGRVNRTGIWKTVEHLRFLPPLGLVHHAEVREAADGEAEVYVQDPPLFPVFTYVDDWGAFQGLSGVPFSEPPQVEVRVGVNPRNFGTQEAKAIEDEVGEKYSPFEQYAEFPPLEVWITLSVLWGIGQFSGAFLRELGKISAEEFAASVKRWVKRSRDPNRTCVFTIEFQLPNGASISGFVLAGSEGIEGAVSSVLAATGDLAAIAGLQKERELFPGLRQGAFFLTEEGWQLGWWTDGERVVQTKWFQENPPDVEGVLGRKPFWEMSTEELKEIQQDNLEKYLQAQRGSEKSSPE